MTGDPVANRKGLDQFLRTYGVPRQAFKAMAYVATGLQRGDSQRAVAEALLAEGIGITFDWPLYGSASGRSYPDIAHDEVEGVRRADFLVVLLPGGRGTHVELGAALALGKPVFLQAETEAALYQDNMRCVFHEHRLVRQIVGPQTALLDAIRIWMESRP